MNDTFGEAILREELDLEVRLRLRLLETIESRYYWALILRENLKGHLCESTDVYIPNFTDSKLKFKHDRSS